MSATRSSPSILWSCIARNDIVLAKADTSDSWEENDAERKRMVTETACQLLQKKPTPGWEFHTSNVPLAGEGGNEIQGNSLMRGARRRQKLKGMKFHVYDHSSNDEDTTAAPEFRIWVFACVYDPSKFLNAQDSKQQVQSFVEKMVGISEVFRETDDSWKYGSSLAAQSSFGPTLKQRMEDVTFMGKMAMVNSKLNEVEAIMSRNIEMILERSEKLESLQEEATRLQEMSSVFKKRSKDIKRKMLWQNARHGLVLGTAITAGAAAVIVPTVIAIL